MGLIAAVGVEELKDIVDIQGFLELEAAPGAETTELGENLGPG